MSPVTPDNAQYRRLLTFMLEQCGIAQWCDVVRWTERGPLGLPIPRRPGRGERRGPVAKLVVIPNGMRSERPLDVQSMREAVDKLLTGAVQAPADILDNIRADVAAGAFLGRVGQPECATLFHVALFGKASASGVATTV